MQILQSARAMPSATTDVAIVLGAAVWRDRPSPVFAARIDYALDLLAAGQVQYLILTGGVGGGDQRAESIVAAYYALDHSVAPNDLADRLRCETISTTTWSNLVMAAVIMQHNHWQSATLVSDPLHLYRAQLMARDLGIDAQLGPTPYTRYRTWNSQIPFFLREIFFVYQYHLQRWWPTRMVRPTVGEGLCIVG